MSRSATTSIAALMLFAAGCAEPPVGSRRAKITEGALHEGHPAVGQVIFALSGGEEQDGACTATLVGARTVLTAAHCLLYPKTEFAAGTTKYLTERVVSHPKFTKSQAHLYDIGIVILKSAPPLEPARLSPDAATVGTKVAMIGFGETSSGAKDHGVKRIASNEVSGVKPLYFVIAGSAGDYGNACYGDSGGPVYVDLDTTDESILGVMSYITGECGSSSTYVTPIDLYLDWLKQESGGDVKVLAPPPPPDAGVDLLAPDMAVPEDDADDSGCATGGSPGGCAALFFALLLLFIRKR